MIRTSLYSCSFSTWVLIAVLTSWGAASDPDKSDRSDVSDQLDVSDVSDISGQSNLENAVEYCELSDVWELSTRHLPDCVSAINTLDPGFSVRRFTNGRWDRGTIDSALDLGDRLPIVYVHGNFMERNNAIQRALIVNSYLKRRAHRPYRLIMLSWPSQKEHFALHDIRNNAIIAEREALYLAWLLERLGQQPQVSLLGFSFGARSVTGALHLVSGGNIRGLQHVNASESGGVQSVYRVGLVAPAVDRSWLMPRGRHREAMERVDVLINLYNSQDPILRRFRFLDRVARPVAAGFAGFSGIENFSNPPATEPLAAHPRVLQFDCGPRVGNTHDERTYYGACPRFGTLLDSLLWNEAIESCQPQ